MDSPRHLSVHIDRPVQDVYDYASDPANAPEWAAGLTDAGFAADAEAVQADLHSLKQRLEQ